MQTNSIMIRFGLASLLVLASSLTAVAQDEEALQKKFSQGQELVQQEKYGEAIKLFRDVTEANEDFGAGWFFLGFALHSNGQLDEAIKVHQKAAGFERFAGIATYNLGCAYALKNNRDAAIEALQQSVENGFDQVDQFEIDSDLFSLHTDVRFAKILADLNGEDEVVKQLVEAEEFLGTGDFAKAAEVYGAIVETDDRNAFATYRLGYSLHGAGELEAALEMHTRATKFDGVAPIAHYNIGCVHSLNGNVDKAMKHLEKAVKLGFVRSDAYQTDPDLENVRADERFESLVSALKKGHSQKSKKQKHKSKKEHDGQGGDDH